MRWFEMSNSGNCNPIRKTVLIHMLFFINFGNVNSHMEHPLYIYICVIFYILYKMITHVILSFQNCWKIQIIKKNNFWKSKIINGFFTRQLGETREG